MDTCPTQSEPHVVEQAKNVITQVTEQHGLNSDELYHESIVSDDVLELDRFLDISNHCLIH